MQQVKIFSQPCLNGGLKKLESEVKDWLNGGEPQQIHERSTAIYSASANADPTVVITIWYDDGYERLRSTPPKAT
jgi:hypothetical protein